ncbi:MAG: hypothetical protein ACOC33_03285 [bacterium]
MYVIVRGDLSTEYRMVQGAHALAQVAINNPVDFEKWGNEYLIFLKVWNYNSIVSLFYKLLSEGYAITKFNEPDLNGQMTAIALYTEVDNPLIKNLPLA